MALTRRSVLRSLSAALGAVPIVGRLIAKPTTGPVTRLSYKFICKSGREYDPGPYVSREWHLFEENQRKLEALLGLKSPRPISSQPYRLPWGS